MRPPTGSNRKGMTLAPTPARSNPTSGCALRSAFGPTTSRLWWRPAPWGWDSTRVTSRFVFTLACRQPRSRTTNRSVEQGGISRGPKRSQCRARSKTQQSGAGFESVSLPAEELCITTLDQLDSGEPTGIADLERWVNLGRSRANDPAQHPRSRWRSRAGWLRVGSCRPVVAIRPRAGRFASSVTSHRGRPDAGLGFARWLPTAFPARGPR